MVIADNVPLEFERMIPFRSIELVAVRTATVPVNGVAGTAVADNTPSVIVRLAPTLIPPSVDVDAVGST
jgi:hypothetical protein